MKTKILSLFSYFTILFFISLFIYGCNKKEEVDPKDNKLITNTVSNAKLVYNDHDYKDYLKDIEKFLAQEKDIPTIKRLIKQTTLTSEEKEQFAKAMGFSSKDEFEQFAITQSKRIKALDVKYQLKNNSEKSLRTFVENTLLLQKTVSNRKLMAVEPELDGGPCETKRNNCLIIASAAAVVGHLTCAAIDVATAGLGAFLCHGAVILAHSAANSSCLVEYEGCTQ